MRTLNSIRNSSFALVGQICTILLSFISRTIFIQTLSVEYLGINGLFSNIINLLSLAELGVGSAIIYSMYKPIADKDKKKINAIMNLYSKIYHIIGCSIGIIGLILLPFLDFIIKDNNIPNIEFIYLMFLSNSVISYFFIYKSSILIADQKSYVISIYQYGFNILQYILQIIILLETKNFLFYLSIQIIITFLINYLISKQVDKRYKSFIRDKDLVLSKESKNEIKKNIGAMMFHRLGAVVSGATDNIIISAFVGLYTVGIYSNYNLILGTLNKLLNQIFTPLIGSIGNLTVTENSEKAYEVFKLVYFINFWFYSLSTICLWVMLNPFIISWLGQDYVMSSNVILIFLINFYIGGMRKTLLLYRDTMGLFWNDRYKPIFEVLINLVASLILVQSFGIAGVFLGTLISILTTSFWVDPYILYKHGFNKSMFVHFKKWFFYFIITIFVGLLTERISSIFTNYTLSSIIGGLLVCLIVPNVIFIIIFHRTAEFKQVFQIFKSGFIKIRTIIGK